MLCEFGCWGSIRYFYHGEDWDYIVSKTFLVKMLVAIAIVYLPFPHTSFFLTILK